MLPLCQLLPPGLEAPEISQADVEALRAWRPSGDGLLVSAAGRISVTRRLRPARTPRALLLDAWRRRHGDAPAACRAVTCLTLEGEFAVLAHAAGHAGGMWLGVVVGDDALEVIEGDGAGDAVGRAVAAITMVMSLGLGPRPRAYRHEAPPGFEAIMGPGGVTSWRSPDGALIVAYPATIAPRPRIDGAEVRTRGGLRGRVVMGERECVAFLDHGEHRYILTLEVPPGAALRPAERAFVATVESVEPLPATAATLAPACARA